MRMESDKLRRWVAAAGPLRESYTGRVVEEENESLIIIHTGVPTTTSYLQRKGRRLASRTEELGIATVTVCSDESRRRNAELGNELIGHAGRSVS